MLKALAKKGFLINSETPLLLIPNLIIYNSNKMRPLQNASKAWETIHADSFKKREPSSKHSNNNLSLVRDADKPKTGSIVTPRR